ncbi:MAG: hypothetical protein IT366_00090 [Candidatus Hydrogenedentes bacterium]|nr:hypothetical protein [Candidatus Hydrogenedentota bacterium]
MNNILRIASVFVVVAVTHGLFGHWLISFASLLILILSPPGHAMAQACLALAWTFLFTGTEFATKYPGIAQESTFRFAQIGIWLVAWLRGKNIILSEEMQESYVRHHVHFLRRVLAVTAALLLLACLFRSMSWFHAAWALALIVTLSSIPVSAESSQSRLTAVATLMLTAASIAISLVILEIGARYLVPKPLISQGVYVEDADYFYTLRPDARESYNILDNNGNELTIQVEISSQGIRDRQYGPKHTDEFRIVALGDSYTIGVGLQSDETYPRVLEQLLNEAGLPKHVVVINCGVGGYAPWQERGFLNSRGFTFAPDLVVLQLFPSNDVSGSYSRTGKRLRAIDLMWESRLELYRRKSEIPVRCERFLQQHSWLYLDILTMSKKDGLILYPIADLRFLKPQIYAPVKSWTARNANHEVCLLEWYPELDEAWGLYAGSITGIRDDCKTRGIDLIAFAHGDPISINDEGWAELNKKFPKTPYEQNKDIRLTNELLDQIGIPHLDVLGPLKSYPEPKDVYFQYDGHLTPVGARILATAIAKYLLAENLIK